MRPAFAGRHRRPSRISHRADLEDAFRRKKTPAMLPDGDTFYFDQAFVFEWTMPIDLWIRLPDNLTTELQAWQAAGAAVLTVLARYDKLEREAPFRGWPEKSTNHLSRMTSYASPVVQSPRSPSSPELDSTSRSEVNSLLSLYTKLASTSVNDGPMPAALDTPPFTPQDSIQGDQHIFEELGMPMVSNEADLAQVNSRLATLAYRNSPRKVNEPSPSNTPSSRRSSAESQSQMPPVFDEAAWDVYVNSCKVELDHLRSETLVRFRHLGHGIDRLWTELKNDPTQPILPHASDAFVAWWKGMMGKARGFEDEAKALELPDLEEVKAERLAQGLAT